MNRNNRKILLLLSFLIAICISVTYGQTSVPKNTNAQILELNQPLERQIKGGEVQVFKFNLKTGFYARAEIEQKNIGLDVSLSSIGGKLFIEMEGSWGDREAVSCIAEKDGVYQIEIKASGNAAVGSYTVKLAEVRLPTLNDRKRLKAEAHLRAGRKFYSQGEIKHLQAIKEYEAALSLWRELNNEEWEAITLTNLSKTYDNLSKVDEAIQALMRAMVLFQKTKDLAGEGKVSTRLGGLHSRLKQYDKAREFYEKALIISREIGDKRGEIITLMRLGDFHWLVSQDQKAIEYYEQALIIAQQNKLRLYEGGNLNKLGEAYNRMGQYEKAKDYLEQSLIISKELRNLPVEGSILNVLGNVYLRLRQYEKAIDYFQQSLLISREIKDRALESSVLNSLGFGYLNLSQNEKAKDYFEQSLVISREIKDRVNQGYILVNLGNVYFKLTQYEKSKSYYEQLLVISREIKDRSFEGMALNGLGTVYLDLSQIEKAKDYFEQSLIIHRELKQRSFESLALNNLGTVYSSLGQKEKAKDYFEQLLVISKELKSLSGEVMALSNLGNIYLNLGQNEKAKNYYEQSLVISREIKTLGSEGLALNNLGTVYSSLGQKEKAKDYFEQSLVISRKIESRSMKVWNYVNLALLWERLNKPQIAIFYGKQAVNVFQEIRGNIKGFDKEIQQNVLKQGEPFYRRIADLLISEGRFPEAQAVLDLLKEEEFKQIARRSGEPLFTLPYSRSEEEAIKIVDRLASLGRELSDLKAKPKDALSVVETKRLSGIESVEIPAANKALRQAIEALSTVAPDVKNALDLRMKDNIQNILPALGKGVVALYTVVGKTTADENIKDKAENNKVNIGWILLVTPEFRKAYPIDTKDLEQTVFKFRDALRSPLNDPQPLAQELYKKLFLQTSDKQKTTLAADLETYLGKETDKTLMWSLDGVLRYVPMAALHDGKGYLVEKYRNTVFNTASLGSLKDVTKQNWEIVGLGVSTEGTVKAFDGRILRFSALKGSETELNSIVKEKNRVDVDGIFSGTLKINNDFTKEALFEGARTGAPAMHISSHFWFNPAQEETSFLLLGNGGRLEMTEFQDYPNLFQAVDFLSLSACDTATGSASTERTDDKKANGKEVEGFAYVAQTLGAKSVMASLWQVSDEGTKELMLRFYQIKKAQPDLPKGEALRQAQLSLLGAEPKDAKTSGANRAELVNSGGKKIELPVYQKDEKKPLAHPYYWSPFILIGNWR